MKRRATDDAQPRAKWKRRKTSTSQQDSVASSHVTAEHSRAASTRDTTQHSSAASSRATTEHAQASSAPKVSLLHRRMCIADMGFSGIRQLVANLETISWDEIAQQAEEQQPGLILLTGVPFRKRHRQIMEQYFPAFRFSKARTDGSDMLAAWHGATWKKTSAEIVTLCGNRTALVLTLQRITACTTANARDVSPLANEGALKVLLTKFHQGTQAAGHAFDAHVRFEVWRRMLHIVHDSPTWIIAGTLASNEMQLAQRLKEHRCNFNPSRILSEDKVIACLTMGVTPSTCRNHHMKQLVIIDVPEDTMPEDFMPDDTVPPRVDGRPLSLRSYQDLLLTAMTNANEDGEDLVKLLYGPRRKHSWAADGTLMMEAPTMEECERKLEFALSLLHRARFKATNCLLYTSDAADE